MRPKIKWIKNDPKKYSYFQEGSVFLVALQTGKTGGLYGWDFDVVEFDSDEDGASLWYRGKEAIYDSWVWSDFEYFMLLEGEMPTSSPSEEEER